jgi:hypothetical protein
VTPLLLPPPLGVLCLAAMSVAYTIAAGERIQPAVHRGEVQGASRRDRQRHRRLHHRGRVSRLLRAELLLEISGGRDQQANRAAASENEAGLVAPRQPGQSVTAIHGRAVVRSGAWLGADDVRTRAPIRSASLQLLTVPPHRFISSRPRGRLDLQCVAGLPHAADDGANRAALASVQADRPGPLRQDR